MYINPVRSEVILKVSLCKDGMSVFYFEDPVTLEENDSIILSGLSVSLNTDLHFKTGD